MPGFTRTLAGEELVMEDALLIAKLDNEVGLYVSELSTATLLENGIAASSGLFLYEAIDRIAASGIRVLARVADAEAAHRIVQVFHREAAS